MKAKIRVYGKDQNRTALGIIHAYLKLYPNASLTDLQKAFPYSLNPTGSIKETIAPISEAAQKPDEFFEKPDDLITLKNGEKASLKYLWEKPNFEAIKEHAKQFGIEVASITETPPFQEGSYQLEMIEEKPIHHHTHKPNGIDVEEGVIIEEIVPGGEIFIIEEEEVEPKKVPTTAAHQVHHTTHKKRLKGEEPPKKKNNWWWLLLLLLALLLLLLFWKQCSKKESITATTPVVVTETVKTYEPYWDKKMDGATVDESGKIAYNKGNGKIDIAINNQTVQFDELSTEAEIYDFLHNSDLKESGWMVLDQIHFNFNEINFTPEALAQIKNITAILNTYAPNATIAIEGFADHIGTDKENQAISDERAAATKSHLITDGLTENKITSAIGLRDTNRLCQADDTPLCRAQNRRTEIKITK